MFAINIDLEKCEGCGDCVEICPSEVLSVVEENGKKFAKVSNEEECIGCMACEDACEEGSLTVTEK
jgi:NAD-dependent dihydropyrimidine dehydrogenase PreA subunit